MEATIWKVRVVADPDVLVGKPVVKGTRLAVEFVAGRLSHGQSEEDLLHKIIPASRERVSALALHARPSGSNRNRCTRLLPSKPAAAE